MRRLLRPISKRLLVPLLLLAVLAAGGPCPAATQDTGLAEHPLVLTPGTIFAHALGAIDGVTYSNSMEAFLHSEAEGVRFFELDLSFTADGDLVCFHTGVEERVHLDRPISEVSTAEFLDRRFNGRFTVMTLERFLRLMADRPGIFLVTDTKDADFRRSLEAVVTTAEKVDPSLIRRIIPQFYRAEQWRDVAAVEREHGVFATAVFTLYRTTLNDDGVVAAAGLGHIPVVTMSARRFNESLVRRLLEVGTCSMVHTVNDPSSILSLLRSGVRGVYSDLVLGWRPRHSMVRVAPRGAEVPGSTGSGIAGPAAALAPGIP